VKNHATPGFLNFFWSLQPGADQAVRSSQGIFHLEQAVDFPVVLLRHTRDPNVMDFIVGISEHDRIPLMS